MALKDFKRFNIMDRETNDLQLNVRDFINQLDKNVLDGVRIEEVNKLQITLTTTTTLIPHGLGRSFLGWHLVDIQGDARVWRDTADVDTTKFLPLKASATVVVSLWVF